MIEASVLKGDNYLLDFGDSTIAVARPGKYRVFATYQGWDGIVTDAKGKEVTLGKELGLENVFTGTLASSEITIEIAP